ncbi:RNA-binding protein [Candidatus Micrarchaeota archaeon]|nr:RNA-binding protein [Candidatus Micrarchaeota archaeon]
MKVCVTCAVRTENYAAFRCPVCGTEIVRCAHCRASSKPYVCPKCGFTGP